MRRLHGFGQRDHQGGGLAGRLGYTRQSLGQASPRDELHGEVGPAVLFAHVVDLHDVRMPQVGHRFRLALEAGPVGRPGAVAGEQHLQGDGAAQAEVACPVDDAHAAAAEHRLHLVAGD
jgi:hypothetical protein